MSFSCPNYDMDRDRCWRLEIDCVPGRAGCVLRGNSKFAVPAEERIRQRSAAGERTASEECGGGPPSGDCPLAES